MSDDMVDCTQCYRGIVWQFKKAFVCKACDGVGRLAAVKLSEYFKGLADTVEDLPGGPGPSDPLVALSRFQEQSSAGGAEELESQLLEELGIKAQPGISEAHLLPHEGGDLTEGEKYLRAHLRAYEEYLSQVQLITSGQHESRAEAE